MKTFIMPDIGDFDMIKLHECALQIFKKDEIFNSKNKPEFGCAVVLSIFAIFNPENLPMLDNDIEVIFALYRDWRDKQLKLN